ncbi:hypothetical protein KEM48_007964 [Puccinia striiformis f. sp. tritici PST-130]|nr:hypothetical protein KEM48_007964 [Puccinia striiformis f. sp. tritici PST-130]
MHSIISVALKACVFICVIGLYSGVLGLKCPPPGKPELKFAACTRGVGQPASKPGAPNRNDKFDCGDQFVKFPLCCSKDESRIELTDQTLYTHPQVFSAKPDTRKIVWSFQGVSVSKAGVVEETKRTKEAERRLTGTELK